jgi:hypothetical protein
MNSTNKCWKIYTHLEVGDRVTVYEAIHAYYSGYAGNPEMLFTPNDVGVVKSVRVPCVIFSEAYKDVFVQIEFEKSGYNSIQKAELSSWDAGINYQNIVVLPQAPK